MSKSKYKKTLYFYRGFHMDTTATQKVYPVNEMLEMETENKEEESPDMIWRDLTTIYPR